MTPSLSFILGSQSASPSNPTVFRLLLLLSLVPIVIAIAVRWWYGSRILRSTGSRVCHCNLETWMPAPGDDATLHRAEDSAANFGMQLRLKALADWEERDPKAAKARDSNRRFGMIAPPFSAIIAIFAVVVGKIPFTAALTIFLGMTAIAAAMNLLAIAPELAAITRAAKKTRDQRAFSMRDDEEAVINCSLAHAWEDSVPTVLKWL